MTIASEIQDLQTNLQSAKDAVTTKGGTVGDTGLAGLASEIATIPSGGGGGGYLDPMDRVRFIDYDGTVIEQMSIEDANALTALPSVPTHDGLTGVGWTHSLAEIQATTRSLDVGAMYQNATNPRQSVFYLLPRANEAITLNFSQDVSDGVTIDWGDGSAAETVSGTGVVTVSHTYATVDAARLPYQLTFTPDEGVTTGLGGGAYNKTLFNNNSTYYDVLIGAVIGKSAITMAAFYRCRSLGTVVITDQATTADAVIFYQCSSLSAVVFPSTIQISNPNSLFYGCFALSKVVLPTGLTRIGGSMFNDCRALTSIIIPDSVTTIGIGAFRYCFALGGLYIPSSVTSFESEIVYQSYGIRVIKFENRITMPTGAVGSGSLYYSATGPFTIDCSDFSQVPTLDYNLLRDMPVWARILVPAALESQWKTANVWSTYASRIVGV